MLTNKGKLLYLKWLIKYQIDTHINNAKFLMDLDHLILEQVFKEM